MIHREFTRIEKELRDIHERGMKVPSVQEKILEKTKNFGVPEKIAGGVDDLEGGRKRATFIGWTDDVDTCRGDYYTKLKVKDFILMSREKS